MRRGRLYGDSPGRRMRGVRFTFAMVCAAAVRTQREQEGHTTQHVSSGAENHMPDPVTRQTRRRGGRPGCGGHSAIRRIQHVQQLQVVEDGEQQGVPHEEPATRAVEARVQQGVHHRSTPASAICGSIVSARRGSQRREGTAPQARQAART